jgi:hypothetical protein
MTTLHDPPPMPAALRALIDADQQRPGPPDAMRAGMYATLGATIGLLPVGAATAHAALAAKAASAVKATSFLGRMALLAKAPIVSVSLGAALGAGVTAYVAKSARTTPAAHHAPTGAASAGSATHGTHAAHIGVAAAGNLDADQPALRPTAVEPAPIATAPARAIRSSAATLPRRLGPATAAGALPTGDRSAPIAARVVAPATPTATAAAAAHNQSTMGDRAATTVGALAAEQSLLDPARVALARGDGAAALTGLDLHQRRFPTGALAQEREAMAVQALMLAGDDDAARGRAARFRARYPDSLLLPAIDATLRSHP